MSKSNNPYSFVIALNTKSKYELWNFAFTSIVVKYTTYKQKSNSCSLCEERTQKGIGTTLALAHYPWRLWFAKQKRYYTSYYALAIVGFYNKAQGQSRAHLEHITIEACSNSTSCKNRQFLHFVQRGY